MIQDDNESIKLMQAAIDEGITFFDNAWGYHAGRSEELMGRALETNGRREKVFLMTKNCERDYEGSMRDLEESLRRYTRYQGLVGPLLDVSLSIEGGTAAMSAQPLDRGVELSTGALRYFTQEWLATWTPWSEFIGIETRFLQEVEIGLPDRALQDLYRTHLGCRSS